MSMMKMRLGRIVPAAVIGLIVTSTVVLAISDIVGQRQLSSALDNYRANVERNQLLLDLAKTQKGIELDIVSTQESLTDMSATRGLDGLNDGVTLAEGSADALAEKIKKANELGAALKVEGLEKALLALDDKYKTFFNAGLTMTNAYVAGGPESGNKLMSSFDKIADELQAEIEATDALVQGVLDESAARAHAVSNEIEKQSALMAKVMTSLAILMLINGIGLCIFLSRRLLKPLTRSTDAMNALAAGNLETDLQGADRTDEIGDLARAFVNFRENLVQKREMDALDAENRDKARQQRMMAEKLKDAEFKQTKTVVETLGLALQSLSSGNLTHRIHEEFPGEYDQLRVFFNVSAERLQEALASIRGISEDIKAGSNDLRSASDDLARRTNRQAVSLEETASALEEITVTVQNSRTKAEEAGRKVDHANASAHQSDAVVRNAITAMVNIEESSKQIGEIVGVIESIAFQTNLLALNAGVEAARAGEAGKGFAVVAQEVRELAQKSSSAAKQISTLVDRSKNAVNTGVSLVNQTGDTLTEIQRQISDIHNDISSIVMAAREQASGIGSINSAMSQMDSVTQENLRMVEETTGSARALAEGSDILAEKLSLFQVSQTGMTGQRRVA